MSATQGPNVVVFSTLFPSEGQPQAGVFIRERMFRVARQLPLTVVSPQPWFPFQSLLRRWKPGWRPMAKRSETQDGVTVLRPRFFCVPALFKRWDGIFLALCAWPTVRRLKRAGRLDVLDAHFGYPDGYAATLLGRWLDVPVTITLRGTEARHAASPTFRPRLAKALARASRVFTVSVSLKRIALDVGLQDSAVRVVGNGVDAHKFAPMPKDAARARLGLAMDAPVLVSVGGLVERKGFHRVIDCLPSLLRRFPGLQYLVVGGPSAEGDMTSALAEQVARLGLEKHVRFLGPLPQKELAVPLSAADVFVLSTRNEGWANVFLEAMACGLPVVTTDVGGNAEVVSRPEVGTVVPFGEPEALEAAIEAALRRHWDREAIIAFARGHGWEQRVAVLVEEFRRLAGRSIATGPSLYTRTVSALLFPLHERAKGHDSVRRRRSLEQSQWWDAAELRALQLERLRELLTHAGTRVPYYRRMFERLRFDPRRISSLEALGALPLLTKADIRAAGDELKSQAAGRLRRTNTGGSSGEPLIFWIGAERVSADVAAKWRATRWWGVDIGDPELVVWGSPIELGAQDRVRRLRDTLLRTKLLPAFEMSPEKLDGYVERIRRLRPKMLFGYPSALAHIARHAEARGIALDRLGIRVAFVTSERLYDEQRRAIERGFGCRVANGYGGRDAGFIAHECPKGGMHITAEDLIVETVDEGGRAVGPGRPGEIVVTHLATREFPFIRYRTGDVGVLGDERCACGRGLPLLREIQGRATDFVVARDGTVMHGLALIYVVRDIPGVREFKVIQESLDRTRVLLATDGAFREGDVETIRAGIDRRLGGAVDVRIDRVGEIPREASGKYRYVVSHVAAREAERLSA